MAIPLLVMLFQCIYQVKLLISNDPPLNPNWEKQYKNSLTGKSIKNINGSNDFLIASSSLMSQQ